MMKLASQLGVLIVTLLTASSLVAANFAYKYHAPDGSIIYSDQELGSPFRLVEHKPVPNQFQLTGDGKVAGPMHASILERRNKFAPVVDKAAEKYKMDSALLHAVIEAESAYQPTVVSHAGAIGLMQLMPGTAERFGVSDATNPQQNIRGGTRYLKFLLAYYKNDLKLAIAAYNAGEGAVDKYGKNIPPYKETQHYVKQVLSFYRRNLQTSQKIDRTDVLAQND